MKYRRTLVEITFSSQSDHSQTAGGLWQPAKPQSNKRWLRGHPEEEIQELRRRGAAGAVRRQASPPSLRVHYPDRLRHPTQLHRPEQMWSELVWVRASRRRHGCLHWQACVQSALLQALSNQRLENSCQSHQNCLQVSAQSDRFKAILNVCLWILMIQILA